MPHLRNRFHGRLRKAFREGGAQRLRPLDLVEFTDQHAHRACKIPEARADGGDHAALGPLPLCAGRSRECVGR